LQLNYYSILNSKSGNGGGGGSISQPIMAHASVVQTNNFFGGKFLHSCNKNIWKFLFLQCKFEKQIVKKLKSFCQPFETKKLPKKKKKKKP
jgi:hypothetical protein